MKNKFIAFFLFWFLILGIGSPLFATPILHRLASPVLTLVEPPSLVSKPNPVVTYLRTFEDDTNSNRLGTILPLIEWGILDGVIIAGTPDFDAMWDDKGILGGGGGVSVDRVLSAMFPEIAPAFNGFVPFTGNRIVYAVKTGAGIGWNFSKSNKAYILYFGPQFNW